MANKKGLAVPEGVYAMAAVFGMRTTQGFFFLVWEKIPVGSEKSGLRKYRKYRLKYR
jgi:hypothetical protein